jgi:hypothetical protein
MEQHYIAIWNNQWKNAVIHIPLKQQAYGKRTQQKHVKYGDIETLRGLILQHFVYPDCAYEHAFIGFDAGNKIGIKTCDKDTIACWFKCCYEHDLSTETILKNLDELVVCDKMYCCTETHIRKFGGKLAMNLDNHLLWHNSHNWKPITYEMYLQEKWGFVHYGVQHVLLQAIYECLQEDVRICNGYAIGELVFADSFLMKKIIAY